MRDYLLQEGIEHWVLKPMRARHPARMELLVRLALRDEDFQLERDFESLLRKYRGEEMRRPVRPGVTVVGRRERRTDDEDALPRFVDSAGE